MSKAAVTVFHIRTSQPANEGPFIFCKGGGGGGLGVGLVGFGKHHLETSRSSAHCEDNV